jgi:hypothetical protein
MLESGDGVRRQQECNRIESLVTESGNRDQEAVSGPWVQTEAV